MYSYPSENTIYSDEWSGSTNFSVKLYKNEKILLELRSTNFYGGSKWQLKVDKPDET
jgi:hypothetical protein